MNKHIEELINEQLRFDKAGPLLSQQFSRENETINSEYKSFLKDKYETYLKEIEVFDSFLTNTSKISINSFFINKKSNILQNIYRIKINEDISLEFKNSNIKLSIKGSRNFSMNIKEYNADSKATLPTILINNDKQDLEVKKNIKKYLDKSLVNNKERLAHIKSFLFEVNQMICLINKNPHFTNSFLELLVNKDLLDLKKEDYETIMLVTDQNVEVLTGKMKKIVKKGIENPKFKL